MSKKKKATTTPATSQGKTNKTFREQVTENRGRKLHNPKKS